jgi:3-hydroxyacyl-[acyl-carrier-protein] dehydratase
MKLLNDLFAIVSGGDTDHIQVRLNAGHLIYQAHFPGYPVTPGVCQVQMVGELLGQRLGGRWSLSRIVNLKFVATLSPTDHPLAEVVWSSVVRSADTCHVKGHISADGAVCTKFSLVFSNENV